MRNRREELWTVRDTGNGPLNWFLQVSDIERSGAVLFGRMLALYDHVSGNLSMLQVFEDPDNRGMALAKIGRWLDDQDKRTKQAYSRICIDCPKMGRNEVLDENFDMDLFCRWYALEKDALAAGDILRTVLHRVWGSNTSAMIDALQMSGKAMQSYNTWLWPMGQDVSSCLKAAFIPMLQGSDGYKLFAGPEWNWRDMPEKYEGTADVREAFTAAWKAKEDEILALPTERRHEAWIE